MSVHPKSTDPPTNRYYRFYSLHSQKTVSMAMWRTSWAESNHMAVRCVVGLRPTSGGQVHGAPNHRAPACDKGRGWSNHWL